MLKKTIISAIASLLLLISLSAVRPDSPLAVGLADLSPLSDFTGQEKVHLHLDKPYYVAGDNIWFKAYVLDEHSLAPSTISSVLYVDLIYKNNAVKTLKLPLVDGTAWGDFKLSDSIEQGSYRIRAYTQWMRNAGDSHFFDKAFAIGNRIAPAKPEKPSAEKSFDIQFFPEGGRLVKGIPTKVAVRAINADGSGEKIEGTVSSMNGAPLSFTTNELGLGYFIFNAHLSGSQKAIITLSNGLQKDYTLPKIEDSGYSLMMKSNGSLQIYMSADKLNRGPLMLIGQRNGNVYFKQTIPSDKQMASIIVPFDKLPSGILQLSLINADESSLCERFIFINHEHDKLDLKVEGLKPIYAKRAPIGLVIDAQQQGLQISGSFSVSVTNANAVNPDLDNETNILTSFLLSSDAVSPIDKPNHYVRNVDRNDIDLLMITGNWRHIPWKANKERKSGITAFEPEYTMNISGTLTNNGKPLPNGKVTLVKSAGGFDMLSTTSDSKGRFRFDSLSFADSTKLLVQARTAGDKKNVKILIDQLPGQQVAVREVPAWEREMGLQLENYAKHTEEYYREQAKRIPLSGVNQLKEVEVVGVHNQRENYIRMHSKADQEFTSKELDSASFLSQVLNGKVRGDLTKYRIMLDGTYISTRLFLLNIEPSSLERIEVVSSPHILRLYRSYYPILFATSKRYPMLVKYAPGVTTITPKGFSYTRTFQSPDYTTSSDPRPDLRPTVYWSPNIATDENGRLKINYFNTDQPGKYRIVIEGIGGNRGLARKELYYEVK